MCFSAGASFGAGAVLGVIGIAAIRKSNNSSQVIFAAIPLIFAIQQTTEGFIWLSFSHMAYASWQRPATYIFLMFAQVLWPTWVPLSILLLEKQTSKKNLLYAGLAIGLLVSASLAYRLFTQNINAEIAGYHILYHIGPADTILHISSILYCTTTFISPFISSVKKMWTFGVAIIVSYIIARLFFENYEISIWCFFAAIISIAVFTIILGLYISFVEDNTPKKLILGS